MCTRKREGNFPIHHPITYVSGLFKGPQLNWAALTKEAYAIYMVARKLDYYLREAETTIRSDHLPLKSFLLKNTKNDKVNIGEWNLHPSILSISNMSRELKILWQIP